MSPPDPPAWIDEALSSWRQGDVVLGEQDFIIGFNPQAPLTDATREAQLDDAEETLALERVRGLVVLTQTCDLVRDCFTRPYVEVCPLVLIEDASRLKQIKRGDSPRYLYLPGLALARLVGDLDRLMTLEKGVVATWERTQGWETPVEARRIAQALARKRSRFAFPDAFVVWIRPLQRRMQDKHGKNTPEGRALETLLELRVSAEAAEPLPPASITFYFILPELDIPPALAIPWDAQLEEWRQLLQPAATAEHLYQPQVIFRQCTHRDLSAALYLDSLPLDLDHLSEER